MIVLTEAPSGQSHMVREDSIVSVSPPFSFGATTLQAREVRFAAGTSLYVQETAANQSALAQILTSNAIRPNAVTRVLNTLPGPAGLAGSIGPAGPTGPQGQAGERGQAGESILVDRRGNAERGSTR